MLDKYAKKPLDATKKCAVNHDRSDLRTILGSILKLEAIRLNKVELHSRNLVLSSNGICRHKVNLWTVERSFTLFLKVI
jgi:hypothetical protein